MKKKQPAKRKPSLDAIYRRVLALHTTLLNQMALIRLDIASERKADRDVLKTLADHCARLLREKETLQKMAGTVTNRGAEVNAGVEFPQKVPPPHSDEANKFIAMVKCKHCDLLMSDLQSPCPNCGKPMKVETIRPTLTQCKFYHLHSVGIRCAVCGHLEIDPLSYKDGTSHV